MIILMPPISLTLSTAYKYLNSSSSAVPHHLHCQHRNAIATSPPPQLKPPFPKSDTFSAAVLWTL